MRQETSGEVHFRHTLVSATLVKAGTHRVLPLHVEEVRTLDGAVKQAGELNAAKRLIAPVHQEHPRMPLVVLGDDLYSHEPFILQLRVARLHSVLVCLPTSHPELYKWGEAIETLGGGEQGTWQEGPACRRSFPYRVVRSVPLTASHRVWGTLVEVWEHNRAGVQVSHHAWFPDLAVDADNVAQVVQLGRSRWKIENEQCNVQEKPWR